MPRANPRDAGVNSPFMSLNEVMATVLLSRSSIYRMINNEQFPKPKKLGERAAAWSRKEIHEWIEEKLK